ncbi:efflux RND transporter permease subunit [Myxococcota bacterium]|nr:efflux RND transporter permease subunit [Myxococcota bacterium]MBU1898959.1 efflux RND transporter permease subunit [Myxococcota bacterium]
MSPPMTLWERLIGATLRARLLVFVFTIALLGLGLAVNPLGDGAWLRDALPWGLGALPRAPLAVDAIPDLGENQQIVFTRWSGRSPKDIDDQITYPLTAQLLGLAGVKAIRSASMFGFCSVYVIFNDDVDFYWARARILEKLSALPEGTLPQGVAPILGPDATALGQIYAYTLEGRDPQTGEALGGWDLHELREIQDWTVRYALQAAPGVSEVASVGGHAREYQIDVDPQRLSAYGVTIAEVARATQEANRDVGARTMEINRVEYVVRGIGQLGGLDDLEEVVVAWRAGRPLRLKDLARVQHGPAARRGALDVNGAEAVGGIVAARYGENPMEVIVALKGKIAQLQPSLPQRTLSDGRVSQVTLVPFYDRAQVVNETLATLSDALIQQILITVVVVIVLLGDLRSAAVISSTLPLAVLGSFVLMKAAGVTANVMSLAGVAIAIGTMVDMGIVLTERMHARLLETPNQRLEALTRGAAEVAPAVVTSTATTVISFLPVFGLTAAEGKLFHPLAFTKTFALLAALLISLLLLPTLADLLLARARRRALDPRGLALLSVTVILLGRGAWLWGLACGVITLSHLTEQATRRPGLRWAALSLERVLVGGLVLYAFALAWAPLGGGATRGETLRFVALIVLGLLALFGLFLWTYPRLLRLALRHKALGLMAPLLITLFGFTAWRGFHPPEALDDAPWAKRLTAALPGLGSEFMPAFDEGQLLYMPTMMPHASLGQALQQLRRMDAAIAAIPEVERAVGKLGRAETALDPAPISMFETVITYKPQWLAGADGARVRQWRPHIKGVDDIWAEILKAAASPGLTSAPQLMPINTRIIMLQSGTRASMAIKAQGPTLEALAEAGAALERALKGVEGVRPETVFATRVVGKPYLEVRLDRAALARYGLSVEDAQRALSLALGGITLTTVIEGRARFGVRVRYDRGAREDPEALMRLLLPTPSGATIPLSQVAALTYVKGPQSIKREDTFLTSDVIFDKVEGISEVEIVERVAATLEAQRQAGALRLPDGVRYHFVGSYQNQQRSAARLKVLVPIAMLSIFLVLSLQFGRASTVLIIYSGVAVAVAGGFGLMWLYAQPGFLDVELLSHSLREVFQIGPVRLSVAVWVGFIALVGIATDDGVVMATYLDAQLKAAPQGVEAIRAAILEGGRRRARACLMTTATTILALLPLLTSTGRGADVMLPMAIPAVGGMAVELVTLFVVPILYAARAEHAARRAGRGWASVG